LHGEKIDTDKGKMALVEKSKGRDLVAIDLRLQGGKRVWKTQPQSESDRRAQKSTEKLSMTILTSSTSISTSPKRSLDLSHSKVVHYDSDILHYHPENTVSHPKDKPVCGGGISFDLELIGGCPETDANMFEISGIAVEFCLRFSGIFVSCQYF
jgi:hypothetical protein